MIDTMGSPSNPEELIPEFKLDRVLNQDQAGRRTSLYGTLRSQPAILILERAPFPTGSPYFENLPSNLSSLKNLGANDVYFWYMANSPKSTSTEVQADLKVNLIWPCTPKHVKKYSKQGARVVNETPEIYKNHVRPYMQQQRDEGRLNWVFNIIEGKTEVEDVIFRTELGQCGDEGFLLLPDLNWDRKTLESLHLLGLVERQDIWSLRDLKKKHVRWLKDMERKLVKATVETYPEIEEDQLKLYVHYQPTYYHFHIHIVHVALESGATQATGKAIGLQSIISQLESMGGDDDAGMDTVALTYTIGEASELWTEIFEPVKNRKASVSQ